jgi:hypothetical protein
VSLQRVAYVYTAQNEKAKVRGKATKVRLRSRLLRTAERTAHCGVHTKQRHPNRVVLDVGTDAGDLGKGDEEARQQWDREGEVPDELGACTWAQFPCLCPCPIRTFSAAGRLMPER